MPPVLVRRDAEFVSIEDALGRAQCSSNPMSLAFIGLRGLGESVIFHEVGATSRRGNGAWHAALINV